MSKQTLLPCPFCGGPVSIERTTGAYEEQHGKREWYGVVCRNTINHGGSCAIQQRPSASIEAAVTRWNRRAVQVTVSEKNAEVEIVGYMKKVRWGDAFEIQYCDPSELQDKTGWTPLCAARQGSGGGDFRTTLSQESPGHERCPPAAAPSEFVRVPREPTDAMLAVANIDQQAVIIAPQEYARALWLDLLAAAPPCPDAEARELAEDIERELPYCSNEQVALSFSKEQWRTIIAALRGGRHD